MKWKNFIPHSIIFFYSLSCAWVEKTRREEKNIYFMWKSICVNNIFFGPLCSSNFIFDFAYFYSKKIFSSTSFSFSTNIYINQHNMDESKEFFPSFYFSHYFYFHKSTILATTTQEKKKLTRMKERKWENKNFQQIINVINLFRFVSNILCELRSPFVVKFSMLNGHKYIRFHNNYNPNLNFTPKMS